MPEAWGAVAELAEASDAARAGVSREPRTLVGAAVASVAGALPETSIPTSSIAERLGVTERWIVDRTGVRSRYMASPDESLTDLAASAGARALERAGVAPRALDLVLVATVTADHVVPNAAPLVAERLGAAQAGAVDVGAACTGFVSALGIGASFIEAGRATRVLVVGADLLSRITDHGDRRTAALFADGAGAAVLVAVEGSSRIGPVVLGADGSGLEWIVAPRDKPRIRMAGHETFKHAVTRLSEVTVKALAAAELEPGEIDLFVYHQANSRILRAVGERLALPSARVLDVIGEYGNTSAASIPLALDDVRRQGRLEPGSTVLMAAFGAGFTWGATTVQWGTDAA
jgi:3-oxoacyl-[acyl-carrier-protein] synthase-3